MEKSLKFIESREMRDYLREGGGIAQAERGSYGLCQDCGLCSGAH